MSDTPIFDSVKNPITTKPLPWWAPFAKAIAAAVVGFVLAFLSALLPFIQTGAPVTVLGWVTAIIAGLGTLGLAGATVYNIPNTVKE